MRETSENDRTAAIHGHASCQESVNQSTLLTLYIHTYIHTHTLISVAMKSITAKSGCLDLEAFVKSGDRGELLRSEPNSLTNSVFFSEQNRIGFYSNQLKQI